MNVPRLPELNGNREQNYQAIERWLDECRDRRVRLFPLFTKTSSDVRRGVALLLRTQQKRLG